MKNLASELDSLKEKNIFRSRRLLSSHQEIEPIIDGKKVLSFCSNDYLGLANHTKIKQHFQDAVKKYGVGAGASHLITGHHESHAALEKDLADFLACEKVLLFSTGYMANLGVVSTIASRDSVIYADKLNHASLNDAAILSRAKLKRYEHLNTEQLEKLVLDSFTTNNIILSDGVFSMDGTVTPVSKLQSISKKHHTRLIIDDAHGIGVLGEQGKGCTEEILDDDTILVGTLGKAFGTFGAFVAAKQETIEWLIQRAHSYIYTTALPPAVAEATRTSLQLVQTEAWRREALQTSTLHFREQCIKAGIHIAESETPIQPIILGSSEKALAISTELLKVGILVPAIRPPTVAKNTARLRISLCATHTKTHIDQLVVALEQLLT